MHCAQQRNQKGRTVAKFTLFGTFAYAANKMSGNILVVYPPGGQMENYISGGSFTVSKSAVECNQSQCLMSACM